MGTVTKINFPYLLDLTGNDQRRNERIVVFFGTDFYNLPLDSNREAYIDRTNKCLDYIRRYFKGFKLMYLPHPNEKDELMHLDLTDFSFPEKNVIGELFLYEHAGSIEYVFSTCSWACGSAFAMGLDAAVFLEALVGAVSEETILGYRSYFSGLPACFFINSFDKAPERRLPLSRESELHGLALATKAFGSSKNIWALASDPSLALRAALLIRLLKVKNPELQATLLMVRHNRWDLISPQKHLFDVFDTKVQFSHNKVWYSARPGKILAAWKVARELRKLPIQEGDAIISLSHLMFEENCLLSYFPNANMIFLLESRWYDFCFGGGNTTLPEDGFTARWGLRVFNLLVEPLLSLHQTIFHQFRDGKVINFYRYKEPMEKIYDTVLILMPDSLLVTQKE